LVNANISTGFNQLAASRGFTTFNHSGIQEKSPSELNGPSFAYTPADFNYTNFNHKNVLPINYTAGLTLSNRFFKSKKLGILVSGSYQNISRPTDIEFFKPDGKPSNLVTDNYPSFSNVSLRKQSSSQTRLGTQAKIDYIINSNHKISLFGMYVQLDDSQYRFAQDTSLSNSRQSLGSGETDQFFRTRLQKQSIYNATLQGNHSFLSFFKANWSGVYSLAKNDIPNWDELNIFQTFNNGVRAPYYTLRGGSNNPSLVRQWYTNTDRDLAGYFNLSFNNKLLGNEYEISVGGLYRDKIRDNSRYKYNYTTKDAFQNSPYDGIVDPNRFDIIANTGGGHGDPLTYTSYEKIFAYYFQLKFNLLNRLEVIGGARVEDTQQGYNTALAGTPTDLFLKRIKRDPHYANAYHYADVLPSLNLKFKINEKQNLRASYFAAINRPGFNEYVPFNQTIDNFTEAGNPNLIHATANNFDLRYEYFPKQVDQLLVGVFYKKIDNPIEIIINGSSFLAPSNEAKTAYNYGLELSFTKYFGNFGISSNYTYTKSSITTDKLYTFPSPYTKKDTVKPLSQTRPLQGQADHIGNISFLYKNSKIGLEVQIAFNYTGKKILYVSPFKDNDGWQREMFTCDLSGEKRMVKRLSFFWKLQNLFNTPLIVEILKPYQSTNAIFALPDQPFKNSILIERDYFGQTYLVGLRFKL
jgi:TonB-dependent receptor